MASRRDIRDAFYDELSSAAVTSHTVTDADGNTTTLTLADDDVTLANPNMLEDLPQVAYDDEDVARTVNEVGDGQVTSRKDNSGNIEAYIYRERRTGVYTIFVAARSDIEKEPIYEAIHTQFEQYQFGPWNATDIHNDVEDVRVLNMDSVDVADEEHTKRVDTLVVELDYHRDYELTGDQIESFDLETDADQDSNTTGNTYTVT